MEDVLVMIRFLPEHLARIAPALARLLAEGKVLLSVAQTGPILRAEVRLASSTERIIVTGPDSESAIASIEAELNTQYNQAKGWA